MIKSLCATGVLITAALVTAGLSACSTSTNGGGKGSASAAVTSAASDPSSSHAAAGGLSQEQTQGALLTVSDIGGGFVQGTVSSASNPPPCHQTLPPISRRYPPRAEAKRRFELPKGKAMIEEEILAYSDETTALTALAATEQGLSCSTAVLGTGADAVTVSIGAPQDVTADIKNGADKSEGWVVTSKDFVGSIVVSRVGTNLVAMTFLADRSVNGPGLPNVKATVKTAVSRVRHAAG